jgi:hypothetical protein
LVVAHDARNGDVLWTFQTGAGADAPVVTYEIDGEQYVAILAGGNQYMNSQPGDNLWAFKLGGTVPPLPAPRAPGLPPLPPVVKIAPELLPRYVGTYELPLGGPRQPPLTMTVTVEGGVLKMQFANTPKVEMQPTSDTSFITAGPVTSQISFVQDEKGTFQMTVQGQGPLMRATRK